MELYRWAKASERLPEKEGWYFTQGFPSIVNGEHWFDGKKFITQNEEVPFVEHSSWLEKVEADQHTMIHQLDNICADFEIYPGTDALIEKIKQSFQLIPKQ